jgi:hypothetical protein
MTTFCIAFYESYLSTVSLVQLSFLTREGGGGGHGAESFDRRKAWASLNCSILSDLYHVFCHFALFLEPQISHISTGLFFLHILNKNENKFSL